MHVYTFMDCIAFIACNAVTVAAVAIKEQALKGGKRHLMLPAIDPRRPSGRVLDTLLVVIACFRRKSYNSSFFHGLPQLLQPFLCTLCASSKNSVNLKQTFLLLEVVVRRSSIRSEPYRNSDIQSM